MVAARKAESKVEDAKEKVRARSSTSTEVTDGSKELDDQIARLMATLDRAEQLTPAPTMVGLPWAKTPLLAALLLQVEWPLLPKVGGVPKHQQVPRAMSKMQKSPVLCNALDARAGVIWLGSVQLQQSS